MKRRQLITGFSLGLMVLFSILFQSIHSYEHISQQLSEKKCHHNYNDANGEITHQHHNDDSCFICNFSFGSYIAPENFIFQFFNNHQEIPYFFGFSESIISFSGSLYALRGPPFAIAS
ncbi:hypothetical protein [Flavobacterium flavigenum]|uniref:hypothetical protein n=1 Tax=Flavobacterium flavigenum TaxID=3003258 RepID=UPI00248312B5|nr:hypothetical protein [Flavobacterium flavigenum]